MARRTISIGRGQSGRGANQSIQGGLNSNVSGPQAKNVEGLRGPLARGRSQVRRILRGFRKFSGVKDAATIEDFLKGTFPGLDGIEFITTSQVINLAITAAAATSILWEFGDGSTSDQADPGTKDFGSPGTRRHKLTVEPWTALTWINFRAVDPDEVMTSWQKADDVDLSGVTFFYVYSFVDTSPPATPWEIVSIDLSGLTSATIVYLLGNALTTITGLEDLLAVQQFYVYSNELTSLPPLPLAQRANVTRLRIEDNPMANIDLTGYGANLDWLYFGGRNLPTSLPDLSALTGLQRLRITETGITSLALPTGIMGSMSDLRINNNASLVTITEPTDATGVERHYYNNILSQAAQDAILAKIDSLGAYTQELSMVEQSGNVASDTGFGDAVNIVENATGNGRVFMDAPVQDLTGFTEVDPNSQITVVSNKITIAGFHNDQDAYVYDDYGVDGIATDVWCKFKIKVISGDTLGGSCFFYPFVLSNSLDDVNGLFGTDVRVLALRVRYDYNGGGPGDPRCVYGLQYVGTGGNQIIEDGSLRPINTDFWIQIVKGDSKGSFGSAFFQFSQDAEFTSIVSQKEIVLGQRVNHRYAMALNSFDNNQPTRFVNAEISDWQLWVE